MEKYEDAGGIGVIPQILISQADTKERDWHRLVWSLDGALADCLRASGEPMIRAIRIAWWRDALGDDPPDQPIGHPIVTAIRASASAEQLALVGHLINGWDQLVEDDGPLAAERLRAYGEGRGGALFGLLGALHCQTHGAAWTLWDFACHCSNADDAALALAQARVMLDAAGRLPRGVPRPVRYAMAWAQDDIRRGAIVDRRGVRGYLRLVLAALRS